MIQVDNRDRRGYRFSIIVDAAAVPVRGKEYRQGTD